MRAEPTPILRGATLGALALAAVDLAVSSRRLPGSPADLLARGGVQAATAVLVAVTLSLAVGALTDVARRLARGPRAVLLGVLGASLGALAGVALFSGSGVRRAGLQLPLTAVAVLAGALVGAAVAAGWIPRRSPPRPLWALTAAVLYAVHATVLVRQYPLLHAVLAALALFAASCASRRASPASWRWLLGLPLAVAALLLLGRTQRLRSGLRTSAPLGQYALRLVSLRAVPEAVAARAPVAVRGGPHLPFAQRDLVLVTVDALRADALRANGGRGRMPVADEMARAGVNFRNAYCSTPHTSYSLSSLMLGAHARAVLALHGSEGRRTLAQHLGGAGYASAAFYPPAVFAVDRARFGALAAGHFGFTHAEERDADAADRVRAAVAWLRAQPRTQRVVLWVHFFEPHEGYEVHPGLDFGRDPRSRYESECAQVDRALATLRTEVRALGREPAWVLTADHGEEFGEHGGAFHGTTVYGEQVRVPLVMEVPGVPARVVDAPVSLVDLAPTILGGVGIDRPARMSGDDLGPLVYGLRWERPVFAETGSLRRVTLAREALVADLDDGTLELFNLDRDPLERTNLADARPERAAALRAEITRWEEANARTDAPARAEEDLPPPLLRAMQGERAAAGDVAAVALDTSRPDTVRRRALAILGELGVRDEVLRDRLAPLADGTGAVATDAGLCLALLGDPRGREGAARVFSAREASRVRVAALALARLGDPRGADALIGWVRDASASDTARDEAADALASLRVPEALDLWSALLTDPRRSPRAAEALGALGDRRAIAILRDALPTLRYPLTRRAALGALAVLDAPDVATLVAEEIGRGDPLPDVFALLRALREPGDAVVGRRRVSQIAAGRSRALKVGRDAGPWSPLRRIYLRVRAEGEGEVVVSDVRVTVRDGISEFAVDLPTPLEGHRVRVTPSMDLRVLGIAAR
ncbi:MAG: sulfatase-like hydrolase/transferase [Polyangiales bacterium]